MMIFKVPRSASSTRRVPMQVRFDLEDHGELDQAGEDEEKSRLEAFRDRRSEKLNAMILTMIS